MQVVNIEGWEHLNELEKLHIQNQSYMNLLLYFLDNKIEVTEPYYQYYQEKYLNSYFDLFSLKNKFIQYLIEQKIINNSQHIEWNINFLTKEVIINDLE